MPINITMPALSPTMEEGTLAKWLVKEGDTVESGDIIAEIETDKATMEVEAVDEGVVAKLLVAEGSEGVAVNAVIAVLAEDGEDASTVEAAPVTSAPAAKPEEAPATPEAAPKAATAAAPQKPASASASGDRIKASPLAKRIAKLKGIELSTLTGSGPHGRIIRKDVENAQPNTAIATRSAGASAPASPDGLILPQVLDDRVYDPQSYELVPREGIKISVNDMLIKASALALMDEPDCNASYSDDGIAYHNGAHISVAVAIDGGLITPVIRNAHLKGLAELSVEMKDLATRARDRKLKPQEYMGGTFSLSNLGMFGIKNFGSIINPPEGMIMSVGAGEKKPVVGENDQLEVATVMSVTLTCDHRVIGGAEGAKWLAAFKRYVEQPEAMLL